MPAAANHASRFNVMTRTSAYDAVDVDDASATTQIDTLGLLRADALAAVALRDAIGDTCTPDWLYAHEAAVEAAARVNAELRRLASNPKTRHGSWRTAADRALMAEGYL